MRRLLQFFRSYGSVLYFLLLQGVGFALLASYSPQHGSAYQRAVLAVRGSFESVARSLNEPFRVADENARLSQENQRLHQQLGEAQDRLSRLSNLHLDTNHRFLQLNDSLNRALSPPDSSDSLRRRPQLPPLPQHLFTYLPARVVGNDITSNFNYITLDRGTADGIEQDMGLISPQGVAGVVVSASEHYSIALSLLNSRLNLSARVVRNGAVGTFSWPGGSPSTGKLEYIPLEYDIRQGDVVTTSGYSTLFPEGIVIGTVRRVTPNKEIGFLDIELQLATDFGQLDYVYLISHAQKAELDSLLKAYSAQIGQPVRANLEPQRP